MFSKMGVASLIVCITTLTGCSDRAPSSTVPTAPSVGPVENIAIDTATWSIEDVRDEFGDAFSMDTTSAGSQAALYLAPTGDVSGERIICRDHFKPIDLWWDGGDGNMRFHLEPILLFVGYRTGTYRTRRGMLFQRAVYETLYPSEAVDPQGNRWRFHGRFNALCRNGHLEIGPVVFGGQVLVSQDPVTAPVLVSSGGGGCNDPDDPTITDPLYVPGYDPYSPDELTGGTIQATGTGNCSGSGGGGGGSNGTCTPMEIQTSYDGGKTWTTIYKGNVCETQ